jgi:very-short-patch-repair endonuclease
MRHSPTDGETALWRLLQRRQLAVSFKRQVPLLGYIVDFYASEAKLVVEVDGGYHRAGCARCETATAVGVWCGWRVTWCVRSPCIAVHKIVAALKVGQPYSGQRTYSGL